MEIIKFCKRCGIGFEKGLFGHYFKYDHKTGSYCRDCIKVICNDYIERSSDNIKNNEKEK